MTEHTADRPTSKTSDLPDSNSTGSVDSEDHVNSMGLTEAGMDVATASSFTAPLPGEYTDSSLSPQVASSIPFHMYLPERNAMRQEPCAHGIQGTDTCTSGRSEVQV